MYGIMASDYSFFIMQYRYSFPFHIDLALDQASSLGKKGEKKNGEGAKKKKKKAGEASRKVVWGGEMVAELETRL